MRSKTFTTDLNGDLNIYDSVTKIRHDLKRNIFMIAPIVINDITKK